MKTTIEIDDELYRQAKALAALTGTKMKDLISEALQQVVHGGRTASPGMMQKMKLPLIPSAGRTKKVTASQIDVLITDSDIERL